ncbi:ribosomal protein L32-like [Senna tora]|uniref:Large ribosomal subunit protein bL32m n=1 Tax=Senna tora TaxID=362788 RepID=A0A834X1V0_9FABA|nr:ribosomal protein L32-like [Senna tora]
MLRNTGGRMAYLLGIKRWTHSYPQPPPLSGSIQPAIASPQIVVPELSFPSFSFGGSMELMGGGVCPKKKVSRHKRGIRNGPKALKPVPVIVRCRGCGRVKLPHFFCCSGKISSSGEQNDGSTS